MGLGNNIGNTFKEVGEGAAAVFGAAPKALGTMGKIVIAPAKWVGGLAVNSALLPVRGAAKLAKAAPRTVAIGAIGTAGLMAYRALGSHDQAKAVPEELGETQQALIQNQQALNAVASQQTAQAPFVMPAEAVNQNDPGTRVSSPVAMGQGMTGTAQQAGLGR